MSEHDGPLDPRFIGWGYEVPMEATDLRPFLEQSERDMRELASATAPATEARAHQWELDADGSVREIEGTGPHGLTRRCVVCEEYECALCDPTPCPGPPPPPTLDQLIRFRDNAQERLDHWNAEIAKVSLANDTSLTEENERP